MARVALGSSAAKTIDDALDAWRQGDVAREERWFVHVADPRGALTPEAEQATDEGLQAVMTEVVGLVVVSQTCDVVRSCVERPFVEIAPLVDLPATMRDEARRGRRPRYFVAAIGVLDDYAVDLDRVMTVEKSVVAGWQRTPSELDDRGLRALQSALARKRGRFAFPNDFTTLVESLRKRLVGKHDKDTEEGQALRVLREVRVRAEPAWDADEVGIFFWFVRGNEGDHRWSQVLDTLLSLVKSSQKYVRIDGQVVALEDMTGADYVESDPLDLDHLSNAIGRATE